MHINEIQANVKNIKKQIEKGNPFGERVTLVAATKMQSAEAINAAIQAGVDAVAENKAQEYRDKNALLLPCERHFIGHLQTNKVKYLVGGVSLFHSCDRDDLAQEIAKQSVKKGIVSNVLVQINIGDEQTKGGYVYTEAENAVERLSKIDGINVQGLMAMLPDTDEEATLRSLAKKMRTLFDTLRVKYPQMQHLSMGMSGDYALCIEEGSNMIRVGSTLFGVRNYTNA